MRHDLIIKAARQRADNGAFTAFTVPYENVTLPTFYFTADSQEEAERKIEAWRIARGFRKNEVGVRPTTPDEKTFILQLDI